MDSRLVGTTLLVGAATLAAVYVVQSKKKQKVDEAIPWYPGTLTEFFSHFFSWDGPQHILATMEKLQECVFKAPISFGPGLYIVSDAAVARSVLEKTTSDKFDQANQFFVDTTNGMNFISTSGHRWKHVRRSTVAAFSSENVKLMVQVVENVLDKWIQANLKDGGADRIDMISEMNKITSNVICEAAFDYDLTDEEREEMLADLETCWIEFGQEGGKNPMRNNKMLRWMFAGVRKGQKAAAKIHAFCFKMLTDYRSRLPDKAQPHKIIHMINEDEDYASDHERVCDLVAFCIAGFDTTANTLAFCFRELAQNQEEQTKLRESIRSCQTAEEARVAVKNVTREIIRLYPATALGVIRQIGEDIPVPGTIQRSLPKKALVLTSIYALQRNKELFGKDANEFVPSRWETATPEQLKAFLTFSTGKRNCLGQSLAMAEMTEVVARLCRDYKFEIVEVGRPENLVLFKPNGCVLKATKVQ